MGILKCIITTKPGLLAIGAVVGLVLPPVLKSKTVRKAAVAVTAKSMALKDDAVAAYEGVKEEAQDVYAEAKHKNAAEDVAAE